MPPRPEPPPLRTNDARVVAIGTALWAVALVLSLLFRARLRDDGHLWWIATSGCGFGLGLVGLRYTRRRR